MTDNKETKWDLNARERELEVEVARLQAELDTLRGEDPSLATSRFLAMAAATVDQAVEDARREADEIVGEISAQAETRRDEATRVAAEAEAMAEQMLADADRAQETVDEANESAAAIKAAAEEEAAAIVSAERQKVAIEIEAFAEVRSALEDERAALETYHEELRRRVQELAESMVSFMDTELPSGATTAIENPAAPELDEAVAETTEAVDFAEDRTEDATDDESAPDPWVEMLESAIPEEDRIVDMPDTAIDEIPDGPPATFDGVPILEADDEGDDETQTSASLFSRARGDDETVIGFDDLAAIEDDGETSGLFSELGARLVEQTSPDGLAEALETDDETDDKAFRQFLDGDDAPDPSRDWLLRPEKG